RRRRVRRIGDVRGGLGEVDVPAGPRDVEGGQVEAGVVGAGPVHVEGGVFAVGAQVVVLDGHRAVEVDVGDEPDVADRHGAAGGPPGDRAGGRVVVHGDAQRPRRGAPVLGVAP